MTVRRDFGRLVSSDFTSEASDMIATCQPTATGWNAGLPPAERSGSLRRIDDIVSELLAGYPLAVQAGAAQSRGDSLPPIHAAGASPAEMMLVGQR
jgi:hypothetical protein